MLIVLLAVAHLAAMLFFNTHIPAIVWAGAFVGQGMYSGGRLIAQGVATESQLLKRIQRNAMMRNF